MMVDLTSTASPDFVTTLTHAVAAFRDRGAIALCQRSSQCPAARGKVAKQQRLTYPLESL